jgi:hypothetical protein
MTTKNERMLTRMLTCQPCQYSTTVSSNFRRHAETQKHHRMTESNDQSSQTSVYTCVCGKSYTHRGSLYNHQLNCMNRTTQFSAISDITNQYCDSLQCCESDKQLIHGLVAEYVSDTRKHMSAQMRRYLKRRDQISDPDVKRMLNEFYATNISVDAATKQLADIFHTVNGNDS